MDLTHRIIALKPFKFVVGKEEKEIYLQSALVAKWSKVLDKMMNSPLIEGQPGYAVLADEDVKTIASFAEFVYTGDYHLLTDESPTDSETESHDTGDCQDSDMEFGSPLNDHWAAFATSEEGKLQHSPAPVLNKGSISTDSSEFFIAHTKVIIFADCYGIDAPIDLSTRKLHQALCGFRLSKARVGDILALVRFCYERPGPEKLKRLVASYSAAIMDPGVSHLMANCFEQRLKERGDFATDMALFLASRAAGGITC
ncbi:hypothetical protein E4U60_003015 [Claviceps pazoutovae]|uniref:BTB domain-containing protein n=1 Tax=Claviceps pazoutovae TaxID=1649127 RepID=A0A9P7MAT9_9HYPO|nr:hypothetical protein E4U60_003015 [Claviceps pazoutovae]